MKTLQTAALHFQDSKSNKGYLAQILEAEDGSHVLHTAWGGLGKSFQTANKTEPSVEKATADYLLVLKEKLSKGYQYVEPSFLGFSAEESSHQLLPEVDVKPVEWQPMLLTPIDRKRAEELLLDEDYYVQRKFDGVRMKLECDASGPRGYNRKGQQVPLLQPIAEQAKAIYEKIGEFAVDGELVGTTLWFFDGITKSVIDKPFKERIKEIARVSFWDVDDLMNDKELEDPIPIITVITAITPEGKQGMFNQALEEGWEGLVFKHKDKPYLPGRRQENMKFKLWNEVSIIISNITKGKKRDQGSLVMEIPTGSGIAVRLIGNVASGVKEEDFKEVERRLKAKELIIVDVRYLYMESLLYQPIFLRLRNDLDYDDLLGQEVAFKDGSKKVL